MNAGRRGATLDRLAHEFFDVLIVGGGATGAACARDAALRGLRVALCDHGDFAGKTSSASSKLLHGGLRYLQYLDFGLVFEGLRERRRLLATAPHLCRPVEFVFPAYQHEHPNLTELSVGVGLYHLLALGKAPSQHRSVPFAELSTLAPALRSAGLQGARIYIDCQTDDARLVLENILDAEIAGAACVSYATVEDIEFSPGGALRGARIRDRLSNRQLNISARTIINATGPFSDGLFTLRANTSARSYPNRLRPTLGVHLVVPAKRLPTQGRAFVLRTPNDNRLFFVLPDGPSTLIGTTDTDWRAPEKENAPRPWHNVAANRSDVEYLLSAVNHAFPSIGLGFSDVASTFAGLRPLIAAPGLSVSATSREHEIFDEGNGILTVAGGKLTTLRAIGEQVVDRLAECLRRRGYENPIGPCTTRTRRLPGAVETAAESDAPGASRDPVPAPTPPLADAAWVHLQQRYGSRADAVAQLTIEDPTLAQPIVDGQSDLLAEIVFAVRNEHAQMPSDVLARRTHLARHAPEDCVAALPTVVDRMARELKWTAAECQKMAEQCASEIASDRAAFLNRPGGEHVR